MQSSVGKKVQRRGSLFVFTSAIVRIMQQDYPQRSHILLKTSATITITTGIVKYMIIVYWTLMARVQVPNTHIQTLNPITFIPDILPKLFGRLGASGLKRNSWGPVCTKKGSRFQPVG